MTTRYKNIEKSDILSELLKQTPLEEPSSEFTGKIMEKIYCTEFDVYVPFYQKPLFLSLFSIIGTMLFFLFYKADFSFSVVWKQAEDKIQQIVEYFSTIHFSTPHTMIQPLAIIVLIAVGCIYCIDIVFESVKKGNKYRNTASCDTTIQTK
jgi:hypothetical protein